MNTIELEFPISHGADMIRTLTFRRAKVRDIEKIQAAVEAGGDIAGSVMSVACLTGLPEDVVREIDAADYVRIAEVMSGFLPGAKIGLSGAASPPTSPTS